MLYSHRVPTVHLFSIRREVDIIRCNAVDMVDHVGELRTKFRVALQSYDMQRHEVECHRFATEIFPRAVMVLHR